MGGGGGTRRVDIYTQGLAGDRDIGNMWTLTVSVTVLLLATAATAQQLRHNGNTLMYTFIYFIYI